MKVAWYQRNGEAREVLHLDEWPDPEPGAGEVRVRVFLKTHTCSFLFKIFPF